MVDFARKGGYQMNDEKKKSPLLTGLKIFGAVAGSFVAAMVGIVAHFGVKTSKKIKNDPEGNNHMQATVFQKGTDEIKADTRNAYLLYFCGFVKIKVPKPEGDHMTIDITSYLSKIEIQLPTGVTVNCQGNDDLSFSKEGDEASPVINLIINDTATALTMSFDGE